MDRRNFGKSLLAGFAAAMGPITAIAASRTEDEGIIYSWTTIDCHPDAVFTAGRLGTITLNGVNVDAPHSLVDGSRIRHCKTGSDGWIDFTVYVDSGSPLSNVNGEPVNRKVHGRVCVSGL